MPIASDSLTSSLSRLNRATGTQDYSATPALPNRTTEPTQAQDAYQGSLAGEAGSSLPSTPSLRESAYANQPTAAAGGSQPVSNDMNSLPGSTLDAAGGLLTGGYSPNTSMAYTRELDESKDTMRGQLDSILSKDSDLMKRAYQQGLQEANARGLLNTNLAGYMAQNAVFDQATDIAEFDASANLKQGLDNQSVINQFRRDRNTFDRDLARSQFDTDLQEYTDQRQWGREEVSADRQLQRDEYAADTAYGREQSGEDQALQRDIAMSNVDYLEQLGLDNNLTNNRILENFRQSENRIRESMQDFRELMTETEYKAWQDSGAERAVNLGGLVKEYSTAAKEIRLSDDLTVDQKKAHLDALKVFYSDLAESIDVSFDYLDGTVDGIRELDLAVFGDEEAGSGGAGQTSFQ